jgi:hypothetical protein
MLPESFAERRRADATLLRTLLAQETAMCERLDLLVAERDATARRAARNRLSGQDSVDVLRCRKLDEACDELATELLHVRLAVIELQQNCPDGPRSRDGRQAGSDDGHRFPPAVA